MAEKTKQKDEVVQVQRKETFKELLKEYMKEKKIILSILLSMFVLLDIIGIFISANYQFWEIFLYLGIIMILFAAGISYIVIIERNYFWSILSSIIIGLLPTVEIIIHLSLWNLIGVELGVSILGLFISICGIFLPTLLIYLLEMKKIKQKLEKS